MLVVDPIAVHEFAVLLAHFVVLKHFVTNAWNVGGQN